MESHSQNRPNPECVLFNRLLRLHNDNNNNNNHHLTVFSLRPPVMEGRGQTTADEALSRQPWLPVCLGGERLLAKARFGELAYRVLLTDTRTVWEESVEDASALQRRAQVLGGGGVTGETNHITVYSHSEYSDGFNRITVYSHCL